MKNSVKKLYDVPLLGYLVRLAVAVARLPEMVPYHVARLDGLEESTHALEQQSLAVDHQIREAKQGPTERARLLAELSRLVEKQRAERARLDAELNQRLQEQKDAFYHWLSKLLNKLALVENEVDSLQKEVLSHQDAVEALVENRVSTLQKEFLSHRDAVETLVEDRVSTLQKESRSPSW